MDWAKHYGALVDRARHRKLEGYSERHHVVPRCLGGDDAFANIVRLTPEEHFIAHLLLVKMHPGNRLLVYAAELMTVGNLRLVGRSQNKLAGWLKRRVAEVRGSPEVRLAHSVRAKNDPRIIASFKRMHVAQTGKPRTDLTKANLKEAHKTSERAKSARAVLSASKKGIPRTDADRAAIGAGQIGKVLTDEHRAAIAASLKGRPKTAEHVAKVAAALTGKPGHRKGAVTSEETKQKIRESKLRHHHPDGNVPIPPERDPKRAEAARRAWITKRLKKPPHPE